MFNKSLIPILFILCIPYFSQAGGSCSKETSAATVQVSDRSQTNIQKSGVSPNPANAEVVFQSKCRMCKEKKASTEFTKALTSYVCNLQDGKKHFICDSCDTGRGCQICLLTQEENNSAPAAQAPSFQAGGVYPVLQPATQSAYMQYQPSMYVPIVRAPVVEASAPSAAPVMEMENESVVQVGAPASQSAWEVRPVQNVNQPSQEMVQVIIKRTNDRTIQIEFTKEEFKKATFGDLLQKIEDKEGVEMSLIYAGKKYDDSVLLISVGIGHDSILQESRKLHGGEIVDLNDCQVIDSDIPVSDEYGNPIEFDESC